MDLINRGGRIITNVPELINRAFNEGAGKVTAGGIKSGVKNRIKESEVKDELKRRPGAERR